MFPRMVKVAQRVPAPELPNVGMEVGRALEDLAPRLGDLTGKTVGITAGSRGISSIRETFHSIISFVTQAGGKPVLIAAMGSHGGGTEEGQREVLASLGITEEALGVPVVCATDSVKLGETSSGVPVYCNVEALKVDRLILVNRIKLHTDFSGRIESGICKMMAIGLGNPHGAMTTHSYALIQGYEDVIYSVAQIMLAKLPVLCAVGILENWKGRTEHIEVMLPEEILLQEPVLLERVKASTIKLPFKELDVLVIQEIGKNISGTGMDTKVVGRIMVKGQKEPESPKISRIVVLGLTPESHGNAIGIGLADITTRKVFDLIDLGTTSLNSISSMSPEQGRLPCLVGNDRQAIQSAISTLGAVDPSGVRLVYIKNTASLENFYISEALWEEAKDNSRIEVSGEPLNWQFDGSGELTGFRR